MVIAAFVLGALGAFLLLNNNQTITSDKTTSQYVPVPDSAKGPAINPEKGYLVEAIGDGLYWAT